MVDRACLRCVCTLILLTVPGGVFAQEPLALQARDVLQTHCARCHAPEGMVKGGFGYVLRPDLLIARNQLVPGKPTESELFQRIRAGDMPPRKEKTRPSKEEIEILHKWISAGAPSWQPPRAATHVTERDILRAIRQDLEHLPKQQRRFFRYFTLANLTNAGKTAEELSVYRLGLAKLVNALSWNARLSEPVAIDATGTVVRIDLRDYKWNNRLWDLLVGQYPYRSGNRGYDALQVLQMTGAEQAYVRADWFLATASRPPLYYDLLQLPASAQGLERLLQVEAATNIDEQSVARAGFNGSGVSKNNRVLERHDAGYGAYWKTYDFAENIDRQNIFDRPLGPPPGRHAFVPDGGEMIFHLPNGLHGYFLANAHGARLERAPVAIVSDPNRPDKVVEVGLSCFHCHAAGLIFKADQVRAHVLQNAAAFGKEDVATIKALYPPDTKFKKLLDGDNERYQQALKKLGVKPEVREPINAATQAYEAVVDLPTAAAEVGLEPEEFATRLGQAPALSRTLGALRARGGTVQRDTFVTAFPDLVKGLRLEESPADATTAGNTHGLGGHTDSILTIAFSPDGRRALTGSEDRTLRLWDVATGQELRKFEGHQPAVATVAFAPDGRRAVSGGRDRTLRLWDVTTGQELLRFTGHTDAVMAVVLSRDGKRILSGGQDRTLRWWNAETGQQIRSFTGHTGSVSSVALSPNGQLAVSGSHDRTVRLWDLATGEELRALLGPRGAVFSVAFAPDGRAVAAGGNDGMVRLWEVESGQELKRLEGHANAVIRVAFAPDGRLLYSGSSQYQNPDRAIRIWNVTDGREVRAYDDARRDRISCLAFSPDGKLALSDGSEPVLRLWKLAE